MKQFDRDPSLRSGQAKNFTKFPFILQFLIIPLLLSFSFQSFPQKYLNLKNYDLDSLLLILPGQIDEERVNTLNNLAESLYFSDGELSRQYADEAMRLATEIDYQEGVAKAYWNYAYIRFYQDNYPEALNYVFEALRIFEKQDKKQDIANLYYDVAKTHFYAGNLDKALAYGNIALDKFREIQKLGDIKVSARDTLKILGGLSLIYDDIGQYEKALEISHVFLNVGKKNNFGITEMVLNTFLAGTRFFDLGEIDSAKMYYRKALAYPDVDPGVEALKYRVITWLGYLHYSQGDVDSTIYWLKKSFKFYQQKGFLFWASDASLDLGYYYYKKDDLNSAASYFKQSEKIFDEMLAKKSWHRFDSLKYVVSYGLELYFPLPPKHKYELMWQVGRSTYYWLYRINVINKRSDEALKYYIAYADAQDTLDNIRRNRETMELQTRYESEKKDQQIETLSLANELKESRLQQNRNFLFGLAGLFILILMFGYILFRQKKLKTDQQMLVLQQKLFRSQMNPHFIFNSLASIQNFIVKQDSRKANIFLSRFSELIRRILDNSTQEYITFEKEINTIENYLELQKVRYIEKFDYSMDVDEAIDTETMKIPPMLAQPIIENAIEHGIKHKETKGNIHIRFTLQDNHIIFEVEDDGVGREKAQEILFKHDKNHKSLATAITLERIRVLNKKSKKKISFKILDLKNENNKSIGTRVTFEIPVVFS